MKATDKVLDTVIAGVKIGAVYGTGYIVYQLIKGISVFRHLRI